MAGPVRRAASRLPAAPPPRSCGAPCPGTARAMSPACGAVAGRAAVRTCVRVYDGRVSDGFRPGGAPVKWPKRKAMNCPTRVGRCARTVHGMPNLLPPMRPSTHPRPGPVEQLARRRRLLRHLGALLHSRGRPRARQDRPRPHRRLGGRLGRRGAARQDRGPPGPARNGGAARPRDRRRGRLLPGRTRFPPLPRGRLSLRERAVGTRGRPSGAARRSRGQGGPHGRARPSAVDPQRGSGGGRGARRPRTVRRDEVGVSHGLRDRCPEFRPLCARPAAAPGRRAGDWPSGERSSKC